MTVMGVLFLSILSMFPMTAAVSADAVMNIANAVSAAVTSGTSVVSWGTSLAGTMDDDYHIMIGIEIENWTKYSLEYPITRLKAGQIKIPPSFIFPGEKEIMVGRKTGGKNYGSYGTVSWLVVGKNRRFVIMWQIPYDTGNYQNCLAVGMTREGVTDNPEGDVWYEQMYYGHSSNQLDFNRHCYYDDVSPVIYRDKEFEIVGLMGTDQKTQARVVITALNRDDLALPLKDKFSKK